MVVGGQEGHTIRGLSPLSGSARFDVCFPERWTACSRDQEFTRERWVLWLCDHIFRGRKRNLVPAKVRSYEDVTAAVKAVPLLTKHGEEKARGISLNRISLCGCKSGRRKQIRVETLAHGGSGKHLRPYRLFSRAPRCVVLLFGTKLTAIPFLKWDSLQRYKGFTSSSIGENILALLYKKSPQLLSFELVSTVCVATAQKLA
eukprot:Gb_25754 [translate_table: standard]